MTMNRLSPRVLVADDQPDVLVALKLLLKSEGYSAETVDSPAAIVKSMPASTSVVRPPDVYDLRTPLSSSVGDVRTGAPPVALFASVAISDSPSE